MSLQSLFDEIESIKFDINLSILSGFRSVMMALNEDETLGRFIRELQGDSENRQRTLRRLLELLKTDENSQYMHRHDSALTGYLYALNMADPRLAQDATEAILQTPNLFWARRLARHIREQATIP